MGGNIGDSFFGKPHPAQGSHGDIQLRIDDAPKIFCKIADTWYENVLFPAGGGIHSSNKGLSIQHKSKDVITFGSTGIGIDTKFTGADVPLRITNDGSGYNQILMGGANPELKLGYAGSGASTVSSVAGSPKIFLNMASSGDHTGVITWARAGTDKFALGNTYESATDELRLVTGADPRTEANAGIRMNSSGHIGFHGVSPVAKASHIADATDLADSITRINAILVVLENKGLVAAS